MKTPNDVLGRKINCINYSMCPVCYGCRNYSKLDPDCKECSINYNNNICKTKIHKPNLISKLIKKSEIKAIEKVNWGNNNE